MAVIAPSHAAPDADLVAALRERGQRVTAQRMLIHRALRELDGHATAEQVLAAVADRLPSVSLPTVYATLELLEELGLLRRVAVPGGATLYDPRGGPHDHLVCRRCGAVEDLEASVDLSPALAAARAHGFDARHAEVLVSGLCARCAAAEATGQAAAA